MSKREAITTNAKEIRYEQCYANKVENLGEMGKVLTRNTPKVLEKEVEYLNG